MLAFDKIPWDGLHSVCVMCVYWMEEDIFVDVKQDVCGFPILAAQTHLRAT